jgi:hypothetical protein
MGESQVEIKTRKTESGAVISVGKGCLGFLTLRVEEPVRGGVREPPGARAPYKRRLDSEFAGILQAETRQRVSRVRMLMSIL